MMQNLEKEDMYKKCPQNAGSDVLKINTNYQQLIKDDILVDHYMGFLYCKSCMFEITIYKNLNTVR